MTMDEARQIAAQAWCDPETSGIEMDVRLAEAFARRLVAASSSAPAEGSDAPKGIRRCPDCGGVWFNRDGAKALDEAREEGRREGIEEAFRVAARTAEAMTFPAATAAQRAEGKAAASIATAIRSLSSRPPSPSASDPVREAARRYVAARDAWSAWMSDKDVPFYQQTRDRLADEHDAALAALRLALETKP